MPPRGVDEGYLAAAFEVQDPRDAMARGLRRTGDGRDLGADQPIQQGRLADVGPTG